MTVVPEPKNAPVDHGVADAINNVSEQVSPASESSPVQPEGDVAVAIDVPEQAPPTDSGSLDVVKKTEAAGPAPNADYDTPTVEKNQAAATYEDEPTPSPQRFDRKQLGFALLVLVAIIVVIVLAVFLPSKEEPEPPEVGDPPIAYDFTRGVSLITSYAVETKVRSRLARTTIKMEVKNGRDCSSIHAVSLQLPLDTRITSLQTTTDHNCTAMGDVEEIREARDTFMEQAEKGIPGAYVEAHDSFTHSLQVAIPPLGVSNVELVVEQLLKQRLDEVQFEIPLVPNEDIDSIVFDLSVEDTAGGSVDFYVDLNVEDTYENDGNSTNEPIHLKVPDAHRHDLPKVVSGRYSPADLPANGLLFTDGTCFEHFFHPSSLDPMPRNFVFVLDTSGSMNDHYKLVQAKKALSTFIDSLGVDDTFTIQTFGSKGTVDLLRSSTGTSKEKEDAKEFLVQISARYYNTDIHSAYLEALIRARYDAENSADNVATILIMISDGYATSGVTNRTKIAEHVYDLNEDGLVKIFNLGFKGRADMQLLDAISLMNGGVSFPILQGADDFDEQIVHFLESEVGKVLMSDVNVEYVTSGAKEKVYGETQTIFPILADGYEVVVRGLIEKSGGDQKLTAITSASTMEGPDSWEVDATFRSSLCFQSYAHDRITQLLRLYDASEFLGNDLIKRLVTLKNVCTEANFAKCIREEALALAIKANVVAKGLTALVTEDNEKCMKLDEDDEDIEVCLDGTNPDLTRPSGADEHGQDHDQSHDHEESDSGYYEDYYYGREHRAGASSLHCGWVFSLLAFSFWCFIEVLNI